MVLDQKFMVEAPVAEGGFGVVYRGRQPGLDRTVAIKVLKVPPEYNEASRARFIEGFALEARTIARLAHPSIVTVYDFGASTMPVGGIAPWMALEWLAGPTLADDLRGGARRTPAACIELLQPIFDALAHAHAEGVAHRDVKPANIVKVSSRRGPSLRLLDFGIAKVMEGDESAGSLATHTAGRVLALSPRYAAPEQVGHARTGPWTDVHAMGLILGEMLTGRAAYGGDSLMSFFAAALAEERPTPARFGVDVGAWEPVLARALALTPSERFADAGAFAEALRDALPRALPRVLGAPLADVGGGGVVPAPPVSTGVTTTLRGAAVEARGPVRARSRLRLAVGGAFFVTVAGGLAGYALGTPDPAPSRRSTPPPAAALHEAQRATGGGAAPAIEAARVATDAATAPPLPSPAPRGNEPMARRPARPAAAAPPLSFVRVSPYEAPSRARSGASARSRHPSLPYLAE